ncbi:hypothetical protein FF1_041265 [Malus domestica]
MPSRFFLFYSAICSFSSKLLCFIVFLNVAPISDAKRLIGRRFSDPSVQNDLKLWPFNVTEGADDKPIIVVTYKGEEKQFSAEEISSMCWYMVQPMINVLDYSSKQEMRLELARQF